MTDEPDRPLTARQRRYAAARRSGSPPAAAATIAGYAHADRAARRLEQHPAIRAALLGDDPARVASAAAPVIVPDDPHAFLAMVQSGAIKATHVQLTAAQRRLIEASRPRAPGADDTAAQLRTDVAASIAERLARRQTAEGLACEINGIYVSVRAAELRAALAQSLVILRKLAREEAKR